MYVWQKLAQHHLSNYTHMNFFFLKRDDLFDKRGKHPYYLADTYKALTIFLEFISGEPISSFHSELLRTICSQSRKPMGHKVDPTRQLFGVWAIKPPVPLLLWTPTNSGPSCEDNISNMRIHDDSLILFFFFLFFFLFVVNFVIHWN